MMETRKDPHLSEDQGPGAHLRQAREDAEMSIDQVASALRIERKTVELIEADAYDRLPAPIFVRGYIRGYARALGLAETPILDMYDRQGIGHPPPLITGVAEPHQAHTSDIVVRLVSYAVAAVLLVLVGLWWHSQDDGGFGIGGSLGDLVDWSSDAGEDPPLAAEESGAAPEAGDAGEAGEADDAGGESVAMVSDGAEADDPPRDDTLPVPPSDGEAASGVRASTPSTEASTRAAPGGTGITGTRAAAEGEGVSGATAPLQTGAAPEVEGSTVTPSAGVSASDGGIVTDSASGGVEAESVSVAAAAPSQSGAAPEVEGSTVTPSTEDSTSDGGIVTDSVSGGVEAESVSVAAAAPSRPGTAPEEFDNATVTPPAGDTPSTRDATSAGDTTSGGGAAETAQAGAGQSGLTLEFVHESWVEVYDRDRARLFFSLVQPGRVLSFDGPQPFEVLLGYGEDVRVAIDGQTFDHTPYLQGGVARFSIGSEAENGASVAEPTGAASPDTAAIPDATDSPAEPSRFQDHGQ